MGLLIEDGGGSGRQAHVDEEFRLRTKAITASEADDVTEDGLGFSVNTGTISYTTATESGALWVRNTGNNQLVIPIMVWFAGISTGGLATAQVTFRVYRNPTGGTLSTGGVALSPLNRDYGSARTLPATVLRGTGAALTVTGGTFGGVQTLVPQNGSARLDIGQIVLRPGNTYAVTVQAPAANTAMNVMIGVGIFERIAL